MHKTTNVAGEHGRVGQWGGKGGCLNWEGTSDHGDRCHQRVFGKTWHVRGVWLQFLESSFKVFDLEDTGIMSREKFKAGRSITVWFE